TSEAGFPERARSILRMVMDAVDAREGALFVFRDRPALLAAAASSGFASFPERGAIPLLPRHVHALTAARDPQILSSKSWESFLSANGNIAPELFKCLISLRVGGKLVGALALGHRSEDASYAEDELESLRLLCHYVALAV